jgi:hypothetical protein
MDSLLVLFCDIDDFCQSFLPIENLNTSQNSAHRYKSNMDVFFKLSGTFVHDKEGVSTDIVP